MRSATAVSSLVLSLAVSIGMANAQENSDDALVLNEISANGPFPGNLVAQQSEWECAQSRDTPGYFRSLNAAEVSDAKRSQLYECASFLGSMSGANNVFAWRSPQNYQGVLFMNNRYPGELYLTGGNTPPAQGPVPIGPWVAKVDATTGTEIWRTVLENGNVSGNWVGAANLNILPDGNIPIAFGTNLVKLDGNTGRILQHITLPSDAPADGSNFKHVTIGPDGTLFVKNQTRATPCDIQGTFAAFQCPGGAAASPPSTIVAVNPDTFDVYDQVTVPENAIVPHTVAEHNGKTVIYAPSILKAYRFIWDPEAKKLSQDENWVVGNYLEEGQTTGDAPGILGDWVVMQVNGLPTKEAASAIVAIHQDDPTKLVRHYPFGTDVPTGLSWAPPKAAIDEENSMVFSADLALAKIAGMTFDKDTGAMETAWSGDGSSSALQTLYGPADRRVLGTSRAELDTPLQDLVQTSAPTYKQQAIWLDAKTGKVLAESDFFEPMNFNTLLSPGYGGRFYYMVENGFIALQVMPAE
ncbi:hypothetical protein [Tateyamaria sp. Alg231-49]|uniref:hypothetical protein n=1 Tax=Tateyamaria sp. Alg231-49 TaxID=1922219 RepID=UPI00131F1EB6|nr:hypothetical protein [Tateyamaria sp. Alg231-49]